MTPGQAAMSQAATQWRYDLSVDEYEVWRNLAFGTKLTPINKWIQYNMDFALYNVDGFASLPLGGILKDSLVIDLAQGACDQAGGEWAAELEFHYDPGIEASICGYSYSLDTDPTVVYSNEPTNHFLLLGSFTPYEGPSSMDIWLKALGFGYIPRSPLKLTVDLPNISSLDSFKAKAQR
jgi:hypothetical protein